MRPNKIAVVGPGTVGIPLAALLASSSGSDGSPPPRVVVVQRPSPTSGWKVAAINGGRSPLGSHEPHLERLIHDAVERGTLSASHDSAACSDADVIIIAVQTDRAGLAPEYAALQAALTDVAGILSREPGVRPLIAVASTLAPSTMQTIVRPLLARHGLVDGVHYLLANCPSRAMPGRLVDTITQSHTLVGGTTEEAPLLAASLYRRLLVRGRPVITNSLAAETASVVENAWRDVRVAFSVEVARYCDRIDVDFRTLREHVNEVLEWSDTANWNDTAVPAGALLMPTVGVGGQALPRDGIFLWWRALESNQPSRNSLILAARSVNDASPAAVVRRARLELGALSDRRVTLLGAAYRANCGGARRSPALVLANLLRDSGAQVTVHDPHVSPGDPDLQRSGLASCFTNDLDDALGRSEVVVLATAHGAYRGLTTRLRGSSGVETVIDACALFHASAFDGTVRYAAIGQGRRAPDPRLVRSVVSMYRAVARGVANEVESLVRFLNTRYGDGGFNSVDMSEVRRLTATHWCDTRLERPGDIRAIQDHDGFVSGLAQLAMEAAPTGTRLRRVPAAQVPPGLWFGNEQATVPERETPWPLTPAQ